MSGRWIRIVVSHRRSVFFFPSEALHVAALVGGQPIPRAVGASGEHHDWLRLEDLPGGRSLETGILSLGSRHQWGIGVRCPSG